MAGKVSLLSKRLFHRRGGALGEIGGSVVFVGVGVEVVGAFSFGAPGSSSVGAVSGVSSLS